MPRFTFFIIVFLHSFVSISAQEEEEKPKVNPYEWIIETYQFPADDLGRGFASPERGALKAPPAPAKDANDEVIEAFIRKSNSIVSHYLEINGFALPKGSLIIYDPESLTLVARLPRIAHSSIAFAIEEFKQNISKYVATEQTIFEAPAEMVRDLISRAPLSTDQTPLLEEMEKAVADGKAKILNNSRIETRSGNRSSVSPAGFTASPEELLIDSNNQIEYIGGGIQNGTVFEIDVVLGSDDITIDLNAALNHHYASPLRHKEAFTQRGKTIISSSVTDTFEGGVTSQYTMRDGKPKLVGVWKPEGLPAEEQVKKNDVLHACFISNDVVKVLPLINERLAEMLKKSGEKILPTPDGKLEFKKLAEEIPEGMIVRRYRIPPTFLSGGGGGGGSSVTDPFDAGPSEPRFLRRVTAKNILESAGISFPKGSSANYLSSTSTLVIRNSPEQIELVEAYIMSLKSSVSRSIGVTLHLVEGPGKLMREAARKTRRIADHRLVWEDLIQDEQVSILTTNWIEARSGNRAKVESGRIYHYPSEIDINQGKESSEPKNKENDKEENQTGARGTVSGYFETERIGTIFEVDPVLGADGKLIDLNFSVQHDFAPPTVSNQVELTPDAINLDGPTTRFHQASVTTQITLNTGMTRIVSMWQPEGIPKYDNADIVQAVVIKAEILELVDDEDE